MIHHLELGKSFIQVHIKVRRKIKMKKDTERKEIIVITLYLIPQYKMEIKMAIKNH